MKFVSLWLLFLNFSFVVFKYWPQNAYLIIILIPFLIGFIYLKINWKQWIIVLVSLILIVLWTFLFLQDLSFKKINAWLKSNTQFYYVKNVLINYLNHSIENEEIANFANYLLFNYINESFQEMANTIQKMGISYLFVVSGMHINLIFQVWNKLTRKCPFWFNYVVRIIISLWFGYCLEFSCSTVRVFLQNILKCNKKFSQEDNLKYSCLIHEIFLNNEILNYGFIFSYGCTLISICLNQTKIRYRFLKSFLINICCYGFSLILIINISHQMNFATILFSFILSPCINVIFAITLIFIFIPYAYYVIYFPIHGFLFIISSLKEINIIIRFKILPNLIISCYYFLISGLFIWLRLLTANKTFNINAIQQPIEINKKESFK